MANTQYDAVLGSTFSFTFTPTTGTPFGSAQAQVQEDTPADMKVDTVKYTPISGTNAGVEEFVLGKFPVSEHKIKATYQKAEHIAALACLAAKVKGTLVATYVDGLVETYAGSALTSVQMSASNADSEITDELTFTCPVPATTA
jgi:hypothetical protein